MAQGSSLAGDPDARPLLAGWYKGAEVAFLDFGRAPLAPAPIYVFVTGFSGDEPQFLRAQGSIVDVVPGDGAEYRDMWDVHFAHVGADYQPDRIQDAATLLAEALRGGITVRRAGAPSGTARSCWWTVARRPGAGSLPDCSGARDPPRLNPQPSTHNETS